MVFGLIYRSQCISLTNSAFRLPFWIRVRIYKDLELLARSESNQTAPEHDIDPKVCELFSNSELVS
jgi:hypothetical protein